MESNDRAGIQVAQPKTAAERSAVASLCGSALDLPMPLLVDSIDDRVGRAYSGFPDRLYLLNRSGHVVYKGGRGPFGYKARELEQTLIMMLLDEAAPKPQAADKPDSAK
jgi:type I thyroxine 5'-deiodinase